MVSFEFAMFESSLIWLANISKCNVSANTADYGAGIGFYQSNYLIAQSIISSNSGQHGGGIYMDASQGEINFCDINSNVATVNGAGVNINTLGGPTLFYSSIRFFINS